MKWIIAIALFSSAFAYASFDEHAIRYLSPWDLVFKLKQTFPTNTKSSCSDLRLIANDFGADEPTTGSPVANSPTPLTIRWLEVCTGELTKAAFVKDTIPWQKKSAKDQQKILEGLVTQVLGEDEVIKSFGMISDVNDFVAKVQKRFAKEKATTSEIKRKFALDLVLRDEFLSY